MDEAYKFMQSIQENVKSKDDFDVYGKNIANRILGANQNDRAISIAKHHIDNILFQLEMGAFAVSEEVTPDKRLSLYQLPNDLRSYRYHTEMYYSSLASLTPSQLLQLCHHSTHHRPQHKVIQYIHFIYRDINTSQHHCNLIRKLNKLRQR